MRYLMLFSLFLVTMSTAYCQTDSIHYSFTDTIHNSFVDKVQGIPITYLQPETPAYYPYGRDSLTKFLSQNLPAEMHSHYMTNLYVVIQFLVKQDSTLSNFTFISGNKTLLEDAIKALKLSQPWIPAIDKSKSVQSLVKMKVNFPQPG